MTQRTILIAGGSGLIGQRLTDRLIKEGFKVHILSRSKRSDPRPEVDYFIWDITKGEIDSEVWEGVTDLVQLTGAPIADRKWTESYKKILIDSRVESSALLARSMQSNNMYLDHIYSASAIGYYGNRPGEEILTESSSPGSSFTSELVVAWEAAGTRLKKYAQEHTLMRIGLVLDREEGFLQKFTPGLAALTAPYFGRGDQYFSWIHIDDLVSYVLWSMDKHLPEVVNLVAPESVSSKVFAKTLAQVSRFPAFAVSVPEFGIKWAFGQRAEVILMGSNVQPQALINQEFPFKFYDLQSALEDLI